MTVVSSTVLRRQIGREFLRLRKAADLTVEQAAKRAEMGKSTITRIEQGADTVRFKERDVRALLDVYATPAEQVELLVGMTKDARAGSGESWWQSSVSTAIPKRFVLFVSLEDAATAIHLYANELIPGLLQTREYAEALGRPWHLGESELSQYLETRLQRQALLARPNAPRFEAILSEAAIRRPIGGPAVMSAQLRRLVDESERRNISIRILPFDVGDYIGLGNAFCELSFPVDEDGTPTEPPLVYVDTLVGSLYHKDPAEVTVYETAWNDLATKALDDVSSVELIRTVMEAFDRG